VILGSSSVGSAAAGDRVDLSFNLSRLDDRFPELLWLPPATTAVADTLRASLYFRISALPTSRKCGKLCQHVFIVQLPDTP
jgi:hypothetical protein